MAKAVETEHMNWKGEGAKPEITGNYTTLIQGVDRKDQKLHYYHDAKYHETGKRFCVIFATDGSLNTLRTGDADLRLYNCAGQVTQICVFNTVKLGTSASSP